MIRPRSDWGSALPVTGPLEVEDDVRFLLVHHTASSNDYSQDEVADEIRGFYRFHTGPEKGWPDVAYNFFIDRFGEIWEAREGSLTQPIKGDATGGSQGFAVLCSLIGDYRTAPVSEAQQQSLTQLLAWLGERHGIDTSPGAQTTFVSRGSNKWAEGVAVTTATISGHRDMSETTCPGDVVYDLIQNQLPVDVSAIRGDLASEPPLDDQQPEPQIPDLQIDNRPALRSGPASAERSALPLPPLIAGAAATALSLFSGLMLLRTRRSGEANDESTNTADQTSDEPTNTTDQTGSDKDRVG